MQSSKTENRGRQGGAPVVVIDLMDVICRNVRGQRAQVFCDKIVADARWWWRWPLYQRKSARKTKNEKSLRPSNHRRHGEHTMTATNCSGVVDAEANRCHDEDDEFGGCELAIDACQAFLLAFADAVCIMQNDLTGNDVFALCARCLDWPCRFHPPRHSCRCIRMCREL
jgi:hypothetical protein